jgi:hypothetical protein
MEKYWFGTHEGKSSVSLTLIYEIFRYAIWKFKLRRIVPTQFYFFVNFVSCLRHVKLLRPVFFDTLLVHFNRDINGQWRTQWRTSRHPRGDPAHETSTRNK